MLKTKTLGLCIGASNISLVLLERGADNKIKILEVKAAPHEGNPKKAMLGMLDNEYLQGVQGVAVTGRKLKWKTKASCIPEPEAVECAFRHLGESHNGVDVVVSAGGETFMAYKMDSGGKIIKVFSGNKCASGTGEFFLQQIRRMGLNASEAVALAELDHPHKVAGRCSVFCKSDCTHAMNKGAPKGRVVAGLCQMMAVKILELLKKTDHKRVMLVGGVSANTAVVELLARELPDIVVPEHAGHFEALGAALWALEAETMPIKTVEDLFAQSATSFSFLPAIKEYAPRVSFKESIRQEAKAGDTCILGLDVGSTTTKAVLMRVEDNGILASCYLRTNGDPIGASRNCYRELLKEIKVDVNIIGLGVTGSGRQIAGLHAQTPAVINEIIAHAAAAVHFDPDVDTIFEIGGQDAKYTYITSGVASDYAMNEACSAGTGSFLEEAALESLLIVTEELGEKALGGQRPLNFSDQCAAFISSDIKSAIQEGVAVEDVAAGLVYSICMNYTNRVKGNRAVGQKVFMQGGVCYNRAVPLAMAGLLEKDIIVPPEPGLMGSFGVALEVKKRLELGMLGRANFHLEGLAGREVAYGEPFICGGGRQKCDRRCSISRILIDGRTYPFGGACNRYVNLIQDKVQRETGDLDLVSLREKLLYGKYCLERGTSLLPSRHKTVGINVALLSNTLLPLYYNFFKALGYEVLLGEAVLPEGVERRCAEFCYPVEISHGAFLGLVRQGPDIFFMPQVKAMPVANGAEASVTCPLAQAEPYYLKAAFGELKGKNILNPVLDFSQGYEQGQEAFLNMAKDLGVQPSQAREAFGMAVQAQREFHAECRAIGRKFLKELEGCPEEIAVVLFGRPYNAFTKKANMGIPQKFSTRGLKVIPYDFLPYDGEEPAGYMYWALGQMILKGVGFVQRHPQLYPTYITNFSCGPDSFLVGYFRKIMGQKPSLTLELDSHSADAGLDTRIEAFLDVVRSYIEVCKNKVSAAALPFRPASIVTDSRGTVVVDSRGERYPLTHPRVHVLFPSMGDFGAKLMAATLRHVGIRTTAVPEPTTTELKIGKGHSSCKECLPLILTAGSLMHYLESRGESDEILVYFMPATSGPCRFGQYNTFIKNLIEKNRYEDVALISLVSENSYAGFGTKISLRAWQSVLISDVMEDIYSALLATALNKEEALKIYNSACEAIIKSVERDDWSGIKKTLRQWALTLKDIPREMDLEQAPKVSLMGEIYVRRDNLSRQHLVERLAAEGIVLRAAPVSEWLYYCDYNQVKNYNETGTKQRLKTQMLAVFKRSYEKTIKEILALSGFYEAHMLDVAKMVEDVSDLISPWLTGEAILTTGAAIYEAVEEVDGIISLGPFGCMPGRIAESLLSTSLSSKKLEVARDKAFVQEVMRQYPSFPFLALETDGNPFPQVIEARLEVFCLQVKRLHKQILEVRSQGA